MALKSSEGYDYDEELEVRDDFKRKLYWVRSGFLWATTLSDIERKVCYHRMYQNKSFSEIGKLFKITKQSAYDAWKRGCAKGIDMLFDVETDF